MKTSAMMRCPKCEETSELDNLHLLDRSFKREWVGLTDEEAKKIQTIMIYGNYSFLKIIQTIEAKLKEKNCD